MDMQRPLFSHRSAFIGQRGETNENAIRTMLHVGTLPFPESPWHGVRCLAPGEGPDGLSFDGFAQADLEASLRQAISDACPDKRATVSFSGGVDSTLIAALAKAEGIDVEAITIRFRENDPDTENALNIARALKIDLQVIDFDIDEAVATLPNLAKCELPISDSAALSTYLVAKRATCSTILDGSGADALYPSVASVDRMTGLAKVPRIVRQLGLPMFHRSWRTSEGACKYRKVASKTAATMQVERPYVGKVYEGPKDISFIDRWFAEASESLGERQALIAQAAAFRSMGALAQKYTALDANAFFPFTAAADLTGKYLHDTEPKRVLKQMLCQFVPREYVYRQKRGFSMDQRAVFTSAAFIHETRRAVARDFALNGDWLISSLERNDPLPWYLYNAIWFLVCMSIWLN